MNVLVRNTICMLLMFEMKTIGDYHDLYLKADVLLLDDVFKLINEY